MLLRGTVLRMRGYSVIIGVGWLPNVCLVWKIVHTKGVVMSLLIKAFYKINEARMQRKIVRGSDYDFRFISVRRKQHRSINLIFCKISQYLREKNVKNNNPTKAVTSHLFQIAPIILSVIINLLKCSTWGIEDIKCKIVFEESSSCEIPKWLVTQQPAKKFASFSCMYLS